MAKFLRIVLWTSLIIAALIGVLRLTAIRWWQLPLDDRYFEASVAPELHGGDWVILWRASAPKYGDLVLCPEPKTNRPVIGRIIGDPGDHVKIDRSSLTVNGSPIRVDSSCDKFQVRDPSNGNEVEQSCSLEIVGGRTHPRGNALDSQTELKSSEAAAEFDVPSGQVFLVSDNRALPWDSRDFGPVDRALCAETVVFRLVSKDGFFDVPNRLTLIR
jgi:signal peptidase I